MKKQGVLVVLTVFAQLILACNIYAQSAAPDSVPAKQALASSRINYTRQIAFQSRLLNGIKYVEYPAGYTGNAYYQTGEFQNASLHYDDADFYNVPILYDLYKEEVVVKHPADTSYMSLINNKLDKFSIGNHTFIRIDADSAQTAYKTGFYELLYNGRSQIVKKYEKDIQEEKSGLTIQNVFNEHTGYYLRKDNKYFPISGKRALLNLLKDRKKDLDTYIKLNKIDFSGNEEQAIVKVASYYDQLTK